MEDILASIRRILNEDEAPAPDAAAAAPTAAEAPAEAAPPVALPVGIPLPEPVAAPPATPSGDEPLLLTEDMMVTAAAAAPPAAVAPPAPPPMALPADSLLAPAVAAAATASVGQLLRTVASERGSSVYRGGPSIEDVVREELRPLLKAWLDQHLPGIVERLVRAEIERVAGRALA
jgi:cell pole-organizing protein PopZ